jgi:AMMECR1 domain-containing protein
MKTCVLTVLLLFGLTLPVVQAAPKVDAPALQLTDPAAQRYVLALARRAFDTYVRTRNVIDAPTPIPSYLRIRSGVFVSTMNPAGAPRTCMGTLYPMQPDLAEEIIQNAVASAGRDRRFPPVKITELPHLDLIVSIVDAPRPISAEEAASLDPASDGLAVKYSGRYGVVLSGETFSTAKMIAWGRTRAGAPTHASVQFFALHDLRFMESQYK